MSKVEGLGPQPSTVPGRGRRSPGSGDVEPAFVADDGRVVSRPAPVGSKTYATANV